MSDVVDTDEFLEHFGVKGMHWGQHNASGSSGGGGSSRASRKLEKATAKASRVADKQKEDQARDKTILDARSNLAKSGSDLKVAKAQYKVEKLTKGKAAAKEALNKVKDVHMTNVYNANLSTAKERTDAFNEAIWGYSASSLGLYR